MARTASDFGAAFPEMFDAAYRAAYRISGSHEVAEDAASEAVYRAGVRWRSVSEHAVPWVVRVATNLVIDRSRKVRRVEQLPQDLQAAAKGGPCDQTDLVAALRKLPKRQREVVVLRYLGERTEAETAHAMGTTVGTVKSQAHRALATLRHLLEDDIEHEVLR